MVGKWRIISVGDMDTRVDDLGLRTEVTCVTKARGGRSRGGEEVLRKARGILNNLIAP